MVTTRPLRDDVALEVRRAPGPGGATCWVLTTRGRAAHDQHELVYAVRATPSDAAPPPAAVALVGELDAALADAPGTAWTIQPRAADAGDAVMVVPAIAPPAVALPADALALLPVTADERAVATRLGVARVAGWLAHATGQAPRAWCDDPARAVAIPTAEAPQTAWTYDDVTPFAGLTVELETAGPPVADPRRSRASGPNSFSFDGVWRLRVSRAAAPALAAKVRRIARQPSEPVSLAVADDAAVFVWAPGEAGPVIVGDAAPGRTAVALLVFQRDPSWRGGSLEEDGLSLYLSGAQQDALAAALEHGGALTSEPPSAAFMPWSLEIVDP